MNITDGKKVQDSMCPAWAQAYELDLEGKKIFAYYAKIEEHELHVDVLDDGNLSDETKRVMLNNLGGAIFEKLHPGEFMRLIKDEARGFSADPEFRFSKEDAELAREYSKWAPSSFKWSALK